MGYETLAFSVKVGSVLVCKYPKHGRLNVLKFHSGTVKVFSVGPNGYYARITSSDGKHRTMRCDKMIDAIVS
jgi:hypothetical protein